MRLRSNAIHLVALPVLLLSCGNAAERMDPTAAIPNDDVGASVTSVKIDAPSDVVPNVWFVELEQPPAVKGGNLETLQAEKDAFRNAARQASIQYTARYEFDQLWNGLSLEATEDELQKIRELPGVKTIYPMIRIMQDGVKDAPSTGGTTTNLITAVQMTGVDTVHGMGITGKDIHVGIIDSGVDYHHPDLGNGCFGDGSNPNCRVLWGRDFVGDAFSAGVNDIQMPDDDPDDCGGHGTHVAGIVGAKGSLVGVAPDVKFGAYRVFGCSGSTTGDIMLAAMQRALSDGMRIINMSIGSAFTWPDYPTAVAANNMVDAGLIVVASTGNSGANGLYAVGAPGIGDKVIGCASIDNTSVTQLSFTLSPDNTRFGYNPATAAPPTPLSGTTSMGRTIDTIAMPNLACDACSTITATCTASYAPPAASLTGKIALIRRGGCSFYEKARNAMAAGAVGVVLYNNTTGQITPTVAGTPSVTIPVVAITQVDGDALSLRLAQAPTSLTWTSATVSLAQATGNLSSSFSSWGFPPDLSLKPDIAAPGGSIFSTYPLELGGYVSQSGTSMASPHTAGIVALLLQHRKVLPTDVPALLQNYANPVAAVGNPMAVESALRQGAGIVRIDRSIDALVTVRPSKLALGESELGAVNKVLTITNNRSTPVTYNLSHVAAVSTTGPTGNPAASNTGAATVQFNTQSITVPAQNTAQFNVTITADAALADKSFYSGYVVLTESGGASTLRIPYAGFKGDYQSIQVLLPTSANFPWLAKKNGANYVNQSSGAQFTLENGDIPYVVAHYAHPAEIVQMDVYNATKTKYYGRSYYATHTSRSSTTVSGMTITYNSSGIGWNGTVTSGKSTVTLPNGTYVIQVKVLKALGNPANAAHWETWTTPVITIARPY